MRHVGALVCALAVLMTTEPLAAQSLEWGMKGGLSFANLRGDDVEPQETSGLLGFTGGTFLTYRFSSVFAVQPEVNFTRKGADVDFIDEGDAFDGSLKLDYLEVPVFVKFSGPVLGGGPHFAALAGPVFAFEMDCAVESEEQGVKVSVECDEFDAPVRSTDLGASLGAGLGLPVGDARLWLDGRYTIGLRSIDDSELDEDVRNYNFAVTAGFSIPVWNGPRMLASARR